MGTLRVFTIMLYCIAMFAAQTSPLGMFHILTRFFFGLLFGYRRFEKGRKYFQ